MNKKVSGFELKFQTASTKFQAHIPIDLVLAVDWNS
jgi:hypothetical protein